MKRGAFCKKRRIVFVNFVYAIVSYQIDESVFLVKKVKLSKVKVNKLKNIHNVERIYRLVLTL